MSDHLTQSRVLVLNKAWQVIHVTSPRMAFVQMQGDAATALDTTDGAMLPTRWVDWVKLPIREGDDNVKTVRGPIRVPQVIIAVNYDKVVAKAPKLSLRALRERDEDTCVYTGKKLKPAEMSVEHVVPVSKGGKTEWTNVALADKSVNNRRGNQPLEKVGLKLRRVPRAPKPRLPAQVIRNTHGLPEWDHFLAPGK